MIRLERAPGADYAVFILESTGERFGMVPMEFEDVVKRMIGQAVPLMIEGQEIGAWSIEQFQKEFKCSHEVESIDKAAGVVTLKDAPGRVEVTE